MIPLAESPSATFDPTGRAVIRIGPQRPGQSWNIDRISTTIGFPNRKETLKLYKNYESPIGYLDGTRRAYQDTSETSIIIGPQEALVLVWEGGTPGTSATAFILGSVI